MKKTFFLFSVLVLTAAAALGKTTLYLIFNPLEIALSSGDDHDLLNQLRKAPSLQYIEKVANKRNLMADLGMRNEVVSIWNVRAVELCSSNPSNIDELVDYVLASPIAHSGTKARVKNEWNEYYMRRLKSDADPTSAVTKLLNSPLAIESNKHNARSIWNIYVQNKVLEATENPRAVAAEYIDNPLLDDDIRNVILAKVINYEVDLLNEETDYRVLENKIDMKCGSYDLFDKENKKIIRGIISALKVDSMDVLLEEAKSCMKEDKLKSAQKKVDMALSLDSNYHEANIMKDNIDYRILWKKIEDYKATAEDVETYLKDNPNSNHKSEMKQILDVLKTLKRCKKNRKEVYDSIIQGKYKEPSVSE